MMIEKIIELLNYYQSALAWLGIASLIMFLFSLLLLPVFIRKIPVDYFQHSPDKEHSTRLLSPVNILRNSLGLIVVFAGLIMFVLPGQGILTVLIGIAIMQFPRKHQLERWIISRKGVLKGINWLRRKTHAPELKL